jgi:DNA-binding CsgD family transcriptional regulator
MIESGPLDGLAPMLEESLGIWRALGALTEVASVLITLAMLEHKLGNPERAGFFMLEALRLKVSLGDYADMIGCIVVMLYLEFDTARPREELGRLAYQPISYLMDGKLRHGPVQAARVVGVMYGWEDKVIGRHTVQWEAMVTPLIERLGAEMGEAHFAREFEVGEAMSTEEIISLAEEVARPPSGWDANPSAAPPSPTAPIGGAALAKLTQREVEVLKLVAAGLTNAQAAEQLSVTPRTINAHLTSIYSKTGVTSRTGAVRFAIEHGLT